MWYSPPFYIGDVQSGMKVRLAVRFGVELGMQKAFRTYVKLEILESELQKSAENSCCTTLVVKVMNELVSEPTNVTLCKCENLFSIGMPLINLEIDHDTINIVVYKSSNACKCVCHLNPFEPLL